MMRAYHVFMWLFEASIGTLVLVPLILLVRRYMRKALGSRLIYALWLFVIVRLLVPIQLPSLFNTDAGGSYPVSVVENAAKEIRSASFIVSDRIAYAALEQPYERITPLNIAAYEVMQPNTRRYVWLGCYLLGVAAVGGVMVYRNMRFRRRIMRHSLGELDGTAAEQYAALARELRIRAPKAYIIDPLDSACLVGGLRPIVALPAMSAGDRYIQLHELCHAKCGDAVWGLLRSLCCALFWFHPLVWLAARVSRGDCELACDRRVTERLSPDERLGYAELLVRLAACRRTPRVGVLATGMSMTGTRMKQRVAQIILNRSLQAWVLAVAVLVSLSLLATCFATATVIPRELNEQLENAEPMPQDEWLARDAASYFDGFDASERNNTAVSTQYGTSLLLGVSGDEAIVYAEADMTKPIAEQVLRHDYKARSDIDGQPIHTALLYTADEAARRRERYYCYAAGYDENGRLLYIGREPVVSYATERLWERCSGETLSNAEYEARRVEVNAEYAAWAEAHKDNFAASTGAAKELAARMGFDEAVTVRELYRMFNYYDEPYALQHVTLEAPDGRRATFTVEMASERVLALSLTDAFVDRLISLQERVDEDMDSINTLTAQPEWIRAQGLQALSRYFGYTPSGDAEITVAETAWGYWDTGWWEVSATEGDLRYRAEISDDGTLRRVTRTPCNVAFPIADDNIASLHSPKTYNMSEKTIFWLNGGAFLDVEQTYPPEVQQALDAVSAYVSRSGLPLGDMTELTLYTADRRMPEREYDAGIEFTFHYGTDDGERIADVFYSTLQQDIGHIDFRPEDSIG